MSLIKRNLLFNNLRGKGAPQGVWSLVKLTRHNSSADEPMLLSPAVCPESSGGQGPGAGTPGVMALPLALESHLLTFVITRGICGENPPVILGKNWHTG